jgi:hypothetical protein
MAIDIKNLKKVIKLMRKEGVLELKTPEIEMKLTPDAIEPLARETPISQTTDSSNENEIPAYSDLDTLFWSSPGYVPEDSNQPSQ